LVAFGKERKESFQLSTSFLIQNKDIIF